jgi:hypothetical protein
MPVASVGRAGHARCGKKATSVVHKEQCCKKAKMTCVVLVL